VEGRVARVDDRYDRVEGELAGDLRVNKKCLRNLARGKGGGGAGYGARVGEAGGLDEDEVEAALALGEFGEGADEVSADGACEGVGG
jgi:hypothetical protein